MSCSAISWGRYPQGGQILSSPSVLVIIPTYNESRGVTRIVHAVLACVPQADVLVVDDDSPDGTGAIVDQLAADDVRIHVLQRRGPRGLGAAYRAGFQWALRRDYARIVQMDADFSHEPRAIPELLEQAEHHDLVVGSRYCSGGRTVGWPRSRQRLSGTANLYARSLLRSRVQDLTSGFKCWRRSVLEQIDFASLWCDGYGFQIEMTHLAEQLNARIREIPIIFRERAEDFSKMSAAVARKAGVHVARLAWNRLRGHRHPALCVPCKDESSSRPSPRSESRERILALCLGGIGDVVLSFAMLRELRRQHPEAHLTALAMWPQAAELIEDLAVFDAVETSNFQNGPWWRSVVKLFELNQRRFDLSILTFPTNRWEFKVASWLIHARRRVGHVYWYASALQN